MLATHGPQWFDRRTPDSYWPSIGISVTVTAALFAASIVSMKSVSIWIDHSARELPPAMVTLQPPAPRPSPKPRTTTRAVPSRPVTAPTTVPTEIAAPVLAIPVTPPIVAPIVPPAPVAARKDSTITRDSQPGIPTEAIIHPHNFGLPAVPMGIRGGAPIAPAGVTVGSRAANTAAFRDLVATSRMLSIPELARTRAPTGSELAELQQSQRQAEQLARRTTTAGNSRDVHVMMGDGLGGAGAVGGGKSGVSVGPGGVMVSVPFPLFSPGPSPEQRKRNEQIDADYQLRLRRLGDRVLAKHDSIRADSLRRDSLARKRIIPHS